MLKNSVSTKKLHQILFEYRLINLYVYWCSCSNMLCASRCYSGGSVYEIWGPFRDSHGGTGVTSAGAVPVPQLPKLQEKVANSMFFCWSFCCKSLNCLSDRLLVCHGHPLWSWLRPKLFRGHFWNYYGMSCMCLC